MRTYPHLTNDFNINQLIDKLYKNNKKMQNFNFRNAKNFEKNFDSIILDIKMKKSGKDYFRAQFI